MTGFGGGGSDVVIRPIRSVKGSVNQRAPSGPFAIPRGTLSTVMPSEYSVIVPVAASIRPIRFPRRSVNQRAPSGPAAIPSGKLR